MLKLLYGIFFDAKKFRVHKNFNEPENLYGFNYYL